MAKRKRCRIPFSCLSSCPMGAPASRRFLLITYCSLLATYYLLLTTYLLRTTHYSLFTNSRLTTHYLLRTTPYYLLLTTHESFRLPKAPLIADWLEFLNMEKHKKPAKKQTFFTTLCTPFMYNQYNCIFGLTGSIGGPAEREYIKRTYKAVVYEVPHYLLLTTY